jgi:hypothetical protein
MQFSDLKLRVTFIVPIVKNLKLTVFAGHANTSWPLNFSRDNSTGVHEAGFIFVFTTTRNSVVATRYNTDYLYNLGFTTFMFLARGTY